MSCCMPASHPACLLPSLFPSPLSPLSTVSISYQLSFFVITFVVSANEPWDWHASCYKRLILILQEILLFPSSNSMPLKDLWNNMFGRGY